MSIQDLKEAYIEGWEERHATRREEVTNAEKCWLESDAIKAKLGPPVCPYCEEEITIDKEWDCDIDENGKDWGLYRPFWTCGCLPEKLLSVYDSKRSNE